MSQDLALDADSLMIPSLYPASNVEAYLASYAYANASSDALKVSSLIC